MALGLSARDDGIQPHRTKFSTHICAPSRQTNAPARALQSFVCPTRQFRFPRQQPFSEQLSVWFCLRFSASLCPCCFLSVCLPLSVVASVFASLRVSLSLSLSVPNGLPACPPTCSSASSWFAPLPSILLLCLLACLPLADQLGCRAASKEPPNVFTTTANADCAA